MKTTTIKKEFNVTFVTIEEAKALSNRDYNTRVWENIIDSYFKYNDVVLYTVKGNIYDIDLFAIYTLPSGLRLRQQVSYSSCISNKGFTRCSLIDNKIVELHLKNETGHYVSYSNDKRTRKALANICKGNEFVFYS